MKENLEQNKLIAQFMGYKYFPKIDKEVLPGWRTEKCFSPKSIGYGYLCRGHNDLRYDTDWNWMMKVVEKVESLDLKDWFYKWEDIDGEIRSNIMGISVEIENKHCWIFGELQLDPFITFNEETYKKVYNNKLEATFDSMVEFIKWYNVKKENDGN